MAPRDPLLNREKRTLGKTPFVQGEQGRPWVGSSNVTPAPAPQIGGATAAPSQPLYTPDQMQSYKAGMASPGNLAKAAPMPGVGGSPYALSSSGTPSQRVDPSEGFQRSLRHSRALMGTYGNSDEAVAMRAQGERMFGATTQGMTTLQRAEEGRKFMKENFPEQDDVIANKIANPFTPPDQMEHLLNSRDKGLQLEAEAREGALERAHALELREKELASVEGIATQGIEADFKSQLEEQNHETAMQFYKNMIERAKSTGQINTLKAVIAVTGKQNFGEVGYERIKGFLGDIDPHGEGVGRNEVELALMQGRVETKNFVHDLENLKSGSRGGVPIPEGELAVFMFKRDDGVTVFEILVSNGDDSFRLSGEDAVPQGGTQGNVPQEGGVPQGGGSPIPQPLGGPSGPARQPGPGRGATLASDPGKGDVPEVTPSPVKVNAAGTPPNEQKKINMAIDGLSGLGDKAFETVESILDGLGDIATEMIPGKKLTLWGLLSRAKRRRQEEKEAEQKAVKAEQDSKDDEDTAEMLRIRAARAAEYAKRPRLTATGS